MGYTTKVMKYTFKERQEIARFIDQYKISPIQRATTLYLAKQQLERYEKFNLSCDVRDFIDCVQSIIEGYEYRDKMIHEYERFGIDRHEDDYS